MSKSDDYNLVLAESVDSVDQINAQFYGQFPYPWRAVKFDYLQEAYFETTMLNQDLGDWESHLIPRNPRIWIAGCGTNQAIFTALRFPKATVIGSDLSSASLEICAGTAKALGISNLELRQESINQINYRDKFDYVISTGVIHHNADPQAALDQLALALKPGGIMELMVYNRFHWTIPAAFQKAMRILGGDSADVDFEKELGLAKSLIGELPQDTLIGVVSKYRDYSDAMLADELLQPVLHHYTVESLAELAAVSGLEILLPCLNQFDKAEGRNTWNIEFKDAALREAYDALPDLRRWQVTNLLLREKSPWLWFYLQRQDSGRTRKTEKQICEEFLETRFVRAATTQRGFLQGSEGEYKLLSSSLQFPSVPPDASVRKIVAEVDGKSSMREIFQHLELQTNFEQVNRARILLTTPLFPYLQSAARERNGNNSNAPAEVRLSESEKEKRKESKFKKFKSIKPVAISLHETEVVRHYKFAPTATLPHVIELNGQAVDVVEWASSNRALLEKHLDESGAILFRGFAVESAARLERLARTICQDLLEDNGEHQRHTISPSVYTPVFYPAEQQLLWHNENSFNHRWPSRVWFCCVQPAARGGETPIVDSRKVYEMIDPTVRAKFAEKGIMYVRHYGSGFGLNWRTVFQTENRHEVEEKCRAAKMDFAWKDHDVLRTSCVRPAILSHPRTREASWFNQAQHWHVSCLDESTRESTQKLFKEDDLPRHCYYGDGTPIADEEMMGILNVYRQLEVSFSWQHGDVLVLDNLLTAHGRNKFEGERKLLVTMGDLLTYDDV
jgi:SAM-dependent methyltransferase/alpha-ketoglutarate-dependent taurine dioxygenase